MRISAVIQLQQRNLSVTCVNFESLCSLDEVGDPFSSFADEDGGAQSHATLTGSTESCSNLNEKIQKNSKKFQKIQLAASDGFDFCY